MKRLVLAFALGATALLAGCEAPAPSEDLETAPMPLETEAPAAEDAAAPAAETAPETPPTDTSALPPDQRSSEQTVQPESETLFY